MKISKWLEKEIELSVWRFFALTVLIPVLLCMLWVFFSTIYFYEPIRESDPLLDPNAGTDELEALSLGDRDQARALSSEIRQAKRKANSLLPRGIYIVVDTGRNHLYVKKGDQVLQDAVCSTGSGVILRDPDTNREWIFDTPRGVFHVHRKSVDPVWTKPDWAFVEAGQPPPRAWSERIDRETLGEYALYFGDGYMIHGTLYQRYLGRSITHGCVRLGDEDLKRVYAMTPLGTRIYIF